MDSYDYIIMFVLIIGCFLLNFYMFLWQRSETRKDLREISSRIDQQNEWILKK